MTTFHCVKLASRLFKVNTVLITRSFSFKSAISLDKLYPESESIKKFEPPKQSHEFNGYIPVEELDVTYSRSGGPGGQHVNKTNTKVDLRFHVESAKWLTPQLKEKLLQQHPNQVNKEGYFIIRSEKTKQQFLNQADAVTRLREIIYKLEQPELSISPETEEKIRKNKEKAARMRLMEKRMRSSVKASRQLQE